MFETYIPLWVAAVACVIVWILTALIVHFTDAKLFRRYVNSVEESLRYHIFHAMKLENQIAELHNTLDEERRRAADN